jgi:hypothetical protein
MLYDRSTRWNSADLELLPDNGNRYEIIDGELLVTRAPHWQHQNVIVNLSVALFCQDVLTSPLLPDFEQSIAEIFS